MAHADDVGEELARGLALDVLAALEHRWGNSIQAHQLVEDALAHYRLVNYREGEASASHLAGAIALRSGQPASARDAFTRSLELCRRIGHRAGTAAALDGLAAVAGVAGVDCLLEGGSSPHGRLRRTGAVPDHLLRPNPYKLRQVLQPLFDVDAEC